ncbi:MAG TPA: cupin domain-containing protein [Thermoanaerobaculia bacterium]|jgi:quercetin dioxygenase-like cupin family protein|nr:cupin domain-containing protein [Thermoanaerobaculia bacterium]
MPSIIANPAEGARLRVVGDTVRVLAASQDTGGAYEVFEVEGPEGSGPPPHAHPWSEAYVVIDGEAEVLVDGARSRATAGCFYHIPAGTPHAYRITSKTAKFVVITSPSGASRFFTELDAETGGSCDDMAKVFAIAVKHGFAI